jgi:DtxR family Mn-dependent transcriptional regulator
MSDSRPSLTVSVEDYLKAIWTLAEASGNASTSAIAEALDVQPASVTGMVKRLAEAGFLTHTPYKGVALTEEGSREALRIIRRHRILETYLCTRLGYSWDDVHDEAERLEHAASDELIERMAQALEDPSYDPHGSPIPTAAGEIDQTRYPTLAEAGEGSFTVRSVGDDDPARLRYLDEQGIGPGRTIRVVDRAPFEGPITVRLRGDQGQPIGERIVLGFALAETIFVAPEAEN